MHNAASWGCRSAAWGLACGLAALPMAAAAGDWTITPGVGAQEAYTDNVLLTPTNRRSDLVTTLYPSLSITGTGARLQGSFYYSPTAYLYALTPKLNAVGQDLYGNGSATLLPNHLFLDAHAYSSLQPTFPGFATTGLAAVPALPNLTFGGIGTGVSTAIPTNQLTQVTSADASPYWVERFDGFGTAELRYTVSDTRFSGATSSALTPPGFAVLNSNQLINEGTAAFQTGENFGPFASRVVLDAAQSSGVGALHASQTIAVDDAAYALTRRIFALGSLGYENIHYAGLPPLRIEDAIWGVGARLMPRPEVTLTALYGRRYGVTAPYVSLYYAVTARTTVNVTYSEALTTTAQDIADALAVSTANPAGQTVDTRTLLPLAIVNPVLGLQTGLFRSSQLGAGTTLNLGRNRFSLTMYREIDSLLVRSVPGVGISQSSIGGGAQWTRNLSARTNANLGGGYTQFQFPTAPQSTENLYTVGVSVTHQLTHSVNGWAGYAFFRRTSPEADLRLLSNVVYVGISKMF